MYMHYSRSFKHVATIHKQTLVQQDSIPIHGHLYKHYIYGAHNVTILTSTILVFFILNATMTDIGGQDIRYKVYSPNWARVEELGARGLRTEDIHAALRSGQVLNYGTHREFLQATANMTFNDKGPKDAPTDSTYMYALQYPHHKHIAYDLCYFQCVPCFG